MLNWLTLRHTSSPSGIDDDAKALPTEREDKIYRIDEYQPDKLGIALFHVLTESCETHFFTLSGGGTNKQGHQGENVLECNLSKVMTIYTKSSQDMCTSTGRIHI